MTRGMLLGLVVAMAVVLGSAGTTRAQVIVGGVVSRPGGVVYYGSPGTFAPGYSAYGYGSFGLSRNYSAFASPFGFGYSFGYAPTPYVAPGWGMPVVRPGFGVPGYTYAPGLYNAWGLPGYGVPYYYGAPGVVMSPRVVYTPVPFLP